MISVLDTVKWKLKEVSKLKVTHLEIHIPDRLTS